MAKAASSTVSSSTKSRASAKPHRKASSMSTSAPSTWIKYKCRAECLMDCIHVVQRLDAADKRVILMHSLVQPNEAPDLAKVVWTFSSPLSIKDLKKEMKEAGCEHEYTKVIKETVKPEALYTGKRSFELDESDSDSD